MAIILRVIPLGSDRCELRPGGYNEPLKQTLSGSPGLRWDVKRMAYQACNSAARAALERVKAADLAKVIGSPEDSLPSIPVSCGELALQLRGYQISGVAWATRQLTGPRKSAWLCDDMGLGKSLQAIAVAEALKASRVLIVCPAIARQNWEANQITRWAQHFGVETKMPSEEELKLKASRVSFAWFSKRWHVVSYEQVGKLPPCSYDLIVLDEIHYLANPQTKRSEAVRDLRATNPQAAMLGLSGTPITARTKDIWGPLDVLFPGDFGSKWQFEKRYCEGHKEELKIGPTTKEIWVAEGSSNLEELTKRLYDDSYCLRRTKQEVAIELPSLTREVIEVEPTETSAVSVSSLGDLLAAAEAGKIEAATELAKQLLASGRKPLLLCLRKDTAQKLASRLDVNPVTGDTEPGQRAAQLQSAPVGVATIYSVTTAIDLVSFECQIHVGLDWVPSNILQAEARCHRIGQTSGVTIYYLVALGTVDEQVREKVIYRLDNFQAVTGSDSTGGFSSDLKGGTTEELLLDLEQEIMKGLKV